MLSKNTNAWEKIDPLDRWEIKTYECRSLEKLQREWVDVPLYCSGGKFPNEIFENASNEHKHYDNISLIIVSAIVIVFAVPHVSEVHSLGSFGPLFAFAMSSVVIIYLYFLYSRMLYTADVARSIMHNIEKSYGRPGFFSNYLRWRNLQKNTKVGIRSLVKLATIALVAVNIFSSVYEGFCNQGNGTERPPSWSHCLEGMEYGDHNQNDYEN